MVTLGFCRFRIFPCLLALVLPAALGGCAQPAEPYVFQSDEFNRRQLPKTSAVIPREIKICYSARTTSPDAVVRLAEEECAKYSKAPQFVKNEIYNCPLSTPVSARYYCCPTALNLNLDYRCSASGAAVEWLTAAEKAELRKQQRLPSPQAKPSAPEPVR